MAVNKFFIIIYQCKRKACECHIRYTVRTGFLLMSQKNLFLIFPFKTDNSILNQYVIWHSPFWIFISIEIVQQKCSLNYSHTRTNIALQKIKQVITKNSY